MVSKSLIQSLAPAQDSSPTDWVEFLQQHKAEFLESLIDNLPNFYAFWKDKQGRYLGCSTQFARFIGLDDAEEIIGKTNPELDWPCPVGMETDQWQRLLESNDDEVAAGYAVRGDEFRFTRNDGSEAKQTLRFTQLDMRNCDGSTMGSVGFLQDVSHLRQLESTLHDYHDRQFQQLAQHSLQTAQRLRIETETPLANLTHFVNHTLKELPAFRERESIRSSVESLHLAVQGLREDHRRLFGAYEPRVDLLSRLVTHYLDEYLSKPQHPIQFEVDPAARMACVSVEAAAFQSVFRGVLRHARRSANKDEPLTVQLTAGNNSVQLNIQFKGEVAADNALTLTHARHFMKASNGQFLIAESLSDQRLSLRFEFQRVAAPDWLATEIVIPEETSQADDGNTILLISHDKTIQTHWQQRIDAMHLNAPIRFSTMDTIDDAELFKSTAQRFALCLVSEEAREDDTASSLPLIEQCGIANRSIFITNRYRNPQLQREAQRLGVKLLPKDCLPDVPIRRKKPNSGAPNPALKR
jgi:PAS domain S-box-containing protein